MTCNPATCSNGKCNATGECVDRQPRPMTGFFAHLSAEQQKAALEYRGPETHGDPFPFWPDLTGSEHSESPPRKRLIDADSATRKTYPMARGLIDYFPDALAEVAKVSYLGNEKHNPGEEMHHARGKSTDHADCILRHLVGRGGFDGDTRESAALAWRALALLQEELEREMGLSLPRGARAA